MSRVQGSAPALQQTGRPALPAFHSLLALFFQPWLSPRASAACSSDLLNPSLRCPPPPPHPPPAGVPHLLPHHRGLPVVQAVAGAARGARRLRLLRGRCLWQQRRWAAARSSDACRPAGRCAPQCSHCAVSPEGASPPMPLHARPFSNCPGQVCCCLSSVLPICTRFSEREPRLPSPQQHPSDPPAGVLDRYLLPDLQAYLQQYPASHYSHGGKEPLLYVVVLLLSLQFRWDPRACKGRGRAAGQGGRRCCIRASCLPAGCLTTAVSALSLSA